MSSALRLEDVFSLRGGSYVFLEQLTASNDVGFLRRAFDGLARLCTPDGPRPWPFDAGFQPTAEEARRAVVAMFWWFEWSQRDPAARHNGVDPLEWLHDLERVTVAYHKRVAAGSRRRVRDAQDLRRKRSQERAARQEDGRRGAEKRAGRFAAKRKRARKLAGGIWTTPGNGALPVAAVARQVVARVGGAESTVRAWIADLKPAAR